MNTTPGLHHITAITADPQKNLDFYEGFLGQRLVKKTVNFDDPNAYHLYYGDYTGAPGTIMTFFYWAGMPRGSKGSGEVGSIYYAIPFDSLTFWKERAGTAGVPATERTLPFGERCLMIEDPDGLGIGLVESDEPHAVTHWEDGPIPEAHALQGFYGALLHLPPQRPTLPGTARGTRLHRSLNGRRYHALPSEIMARQIPGHQSLR
jgi:catechol 2,3-dioxygenase-like lactoylglutathione lyase family enzyme